MAAPWDGKLSTYLGAGSIGSRPATPNIATGIAGFWVNTADDTLSYYVNGTGWTDVATGGGGSGGVYGSDGRGTASDGIAANYFAGFAIVLPPGATISYVGFWSTTAYGSAVYRVGVYSDVTGAITTKLAESATETGIVYGVNEIALSTPYTNSGSDPIIVWVGFVCDTTIVVYKTGVTVVRYWNVGSTTLPTTAGSQSEGINGWNIYAR